MTTSAEPTENASEPQYGPYDAEYPPPLHFDEWAKLSAVLSGRDEVQHDEILEERRVPAELWRACSEFWLIELARQISAGNLRMAESYAGLCMAELERRSREEPMDREPAPQAPSIDQTSFLTALPDEDALPFARHGASPEPAPSADATLVPSGETQSVPIVDVPDSLPFARPTRPRGDEG